MRSTTIALGIVGSLALMLEACSGGGTSSSTPQTPAAVAVASPSVSQPVSSGNGATSEVTVTIRVPPRIQPTAATVARVHALYGSKKTNPHVQMMSNTSPSASIRAEGVVLNAAAQRLEQSTRRTPAFIPGATETMELVLSTGSTVAFDETASCNSDSCTNTFTGVPVGSGYTATLYLYDSCTFLIAAGAISNVAVTTGTNTPINITLNGVVAYFDVTTTASGLVGDPSDAATYTVTVQAEDWDDDVITTPGVLLDSSFHQITGVTLAQNATDVTPVSTVIMPQADLSFAPVTYTFAGTGTESSIEYTATEVAGSQLVQAFYTAGSPAATETGTLSIPVVPVTLSWTNPEVYPTASPASPTFTTLSSTNPTSAQLEFPTLTESGTTTVGLSETLTGYSGNVTLSDNGGCSGIVSYTPGPTPYQTLAVSPYVALTTYNLMAPSNTCQLTATDTAGRQAVLSIDYDQESLTIQSKARKNK